jgi:adenosylmethionine-8-amino-7-oxononanoate aminotransferase
VGLANLDILEREQLLARSREMEAELASALEPLAGLPGVDEVRAGTGLVAAVTLAAEFRGQDPLWAGRVTGALPEHGVLSRLLADGSLQISPPLVSGPDDFALLAEAISKAVQVEVAAPAS